MNQHCLEVLEYARLLELVGTYAQTAPGRARVERLQPLRSRRRRLATHALYAALLEVSSGNAELLNLDFDDISDLLHQVHPENAVLPGSELLPVRYLLRSTAAAQKSLRQPVWQAQAPLAALAAELQDCAPLAGAIDQTLDDSGEVLDSASPHLAELRRRSRTLENQIQQRLESLLRREASDGVMQEMFVTTRNGRFVVPVRREARSRLPGVVHDHSDSGKTVFVEPVATVEWGNELAEVRLQERSEVRRVLARLCDTIRNSEPALRSNLRTLTSLDAAQAVVRWALDYNCHLPHFGQRLFLKNARHPLLQAQFRARKCEHELVPLQLELPPDTRALVITGSNSGGKTVALKTVGLLVLAAQAGLPIPATADSVVEAFQQVFVDIGDEQSISANLSTFTGHIAQVQSIFAGLPDGRSLVLLDELGTGTDPLEGGALACAILHHLVEADALTLATTHLGVVKTYAHEQPHMLNAAVSFNVHTLKPEYQLEIGRPGASHALNIATRVGLPAPVLERARQFLSTDQLRLEGILAELDSEQRRLAAQQQDSRQALDELRRDRDHLHDELVSLRRERRQLLHDASEQASRMVERTRRQMEQLLAEVRAAQDSQQGKDAAQAARRQFDQRQQQLAKTIAATKPRPSQPVAPHTLAPGQQVWVEKLKSNARIDSINTDSKRISVEVGGIRFTVDADEIGRRDQTAPTVVPPPPPTSRPRPSANVRSEINLVGERVDDALARLDSELDQAALANLSELRIVHGFGTGQLRRAVHEYLRHHPLVRRFGLGSPKEPGGAGVTIVQLRQ